MATWIAHMRIAEFSKIDEFPNEYFDFYPDNAFIRQIKHITNFYLQANENPNRVFPYLSKDEMNCFVNDTISILKSIVLID